jgi:hypothetical protein
MDSNETGTTAGVEMRVTMKMSDTIAEVDRRSTRQQTVLVAAPQSRQAHASASIAAHPWPRKLVVAAAGHRLRRLPGSARHAACRMTTSIESWFVRTAKR